jgi:TetR/AcrR family transcriptional regulator
MTHKKTKQPRTNDNIRKDNYKKILAAAEIEFAKSGFKGTTIQNVADTADLPKANVLYYFKSKSDLYLGVLKQILTLWNSSFDRATANDDPADVLAAYISEKIEISRTRPALSKIFALEIINGGLNLDDAFKKNHLDWVQSRIAVIQAWAEAGKINVLSPHHLLYNIWASCQHYADFSAQIEQLNNRPMNEIDYQQATQQVIQLVLKGCDLRVPDTFTAKKLETD